MVQFDAPITQLLRQNKAMNNGRLKIRKARPMFTGITLERQYQRRLRGLVIRNMKELINMILLPQITPILDDAKLLRPVGARTDDFSDIIVDTLNKLRIGFGNTVPDVDIERLAREAGEFTSKFQRKQVTRLISSQIGIDVFLSEPWLESEMSAFVENNVGLIKTVSSEAFDEIEEITFRGARQGLSRASIESEIQQRVDVATSKANRIARDQVNKFFGQLNMLRQTGLGIDEYIWRTADDNRVRPTHVAKDDRTFKWSEPPLDTGHPGQDIMCRCYGEPKLSQAIRDLDIAA